MEKMINSMDEITNPYDLIDLMFERTDEDGILYIPAFNEKDEDYRCRVDWNLARYESLKTEFKKHYDFIKQIALLEHLLDGTESSAKEVLKSDELIGFWNKFIRPLDIGEIDMQKALDIADRLETMEIVRDIAQKIADNGSLLESDRQFLAEYIDINVSAEDKRYFEQYLEARYKDAEKRLGKRQGSFGFILRSMRLCRLIAMNAPKIVVDIEACALAAAMLFYKYGISRECVDNTRRLELERMELMSEEELDELYRPKKSNTRKSLAPLFVYSILKEKSSSKKHLRHQEILKELQKYPYELVIERKALGRIIHNLTDTSHYAVFSDKTGVWIDQADKR